MSANIKSEDQAFRDGSSGPDTSAAEAALKAKLSRKRTKTGCLTCRKRRIKCGEERPVCKNCIKSKRHCEGYNQRVVFKPPTFEYQPVANGAAHITFQAGPVTGSEPHGEIHTPLLDPSAFAQLRPRPAEREYITLYDTHTGQYVRVPAPQQHHAQQFHPEVPTEQFHVQPRPIISPGHVIPDPFHAHRAAQTQHTHGILQPPVQAPSHDFNFQAMQNMPLVIGGVTLPMATNGPISPAVTVPGDYLAQMYGQAVTQPSQPTLQMNAPHEPTALGQHSWTDLRNASGLENGAIAQTPASSRSSRTLSFSQTPIAPQQHWTPNGYGGRPDFAHTEDYQPHFADLQHHSMPVQTIHQPTDHVTPEFYEHEIHAPSFATPTTMLNAAAVEYQDDDYYDIQSDEDEDVDTSPWQGQSHKRQRTLSRILARNQISVRELQTRRYDTFLYSGILDKYRVENVANPLKNAATARVFAHFVSATGPSLSIFERHPRNTSVLFNQGLIPVSQQGLWTYTLPMAALHHQGLLQAMLALASLHIARLQGASETPSMQHYAWALKRIHASVSNPESRLKLTTIAASMLLGFYEIMTADHMKWNMHLAGAKQLFVETDFVKLTREFRRLKQERAARCRPTSGRKRRYSSEEPFSQDDLLDQIPDIDERLVSEMIGREVRYDGHGKVESPSVTIPPELDLSKFEILKDLYWWYCKQDVYQSIVSGNPLLMDFNRWANCPPRAPLGKGDAVHGSFDHLILLLGRIADFASRDRERKLKQIEANGGRWKPAPGMDMPFPPQQAQPPPTPVSATNGGYPNFSPPGPPSMPTFFGMAPPPRANVQAPASYKPFSHHSMPTPQTAHPHDCWDYDLEAATQAALDEHARIHVALETFALHLRDGFHPLTALEQTPMYTAFGEAKFYRSYDIGCLWAVYNMAVIIAMRSHPHMPPAAHMAAGVAAHKTAPFAKEIGCIVAGIVPGPADQPLNPSLGAALCESCMPSFFAAVQYRDAEQRHETVMRIFSIARRTGFGSAELIANGCETAWVKAAAAGRGPPYTRIVRPHEPRDDPRLNGSWERLDPNAQPNEGDDSDRRFVKTKATARLNWAIGVMGVEDDVEKIRNMD